MSGIAVFEPYGNGKYKLYSREWREQDRIIITGIAIDNVKGQKVICPNCNKSTLVSRYKNKNTNTGLKCENCGEIYHPCKMI